MPRTQPLEIGRSKERDKKPNEPHPFVLQTNQSPLSSQIQRKTKEWKHLRPQEVQDKGKAVRSESRELLNICVYTLFLELRACLCQKLRDSFLQHTFTSQNGKQVLTLSTSESTGH